MFFGCFVICFLDVLLYVFSRLKSTLKIDTPGVSTLTGGLTYYSVKIIHTSEAACGSAYGIMDTDIEGHPK